MNHPTLTSRIQAANLFGLFFTLGAIEGVFFFLGTLSLPKTEAGSAVLFGFSALRLAILLSQITGVILFTYLAIRCWVQPAFSKKLDQQVRSWIQCHEFAAAALLSLLVAWALGTLALEILLNPALFPKAVLYRFLYDRIRWPLLWSLFISLQTVLLSVAAHWIQLTGLSGHGTGIPRRNAFWGISAVIFALLGFFGFWLYYTRIPASQTFAGAGLNALLLGNFVVLYLGLHVISRKRTYLALPSLIKLTHSVDGSRRWPWFETIAYGTGLLVMAAAYLYTRTSSAPLADPNFIDDAPLRWVIFGFGFSQLRSIPVWLILIWLIALVAGLWLLRRFPEALQDFAKRFHTAIDRRPVWLWLAALLFFMTSWLLRSEVLNQDMTIITGWLAESLESQQIHVRLDEMWETNLHTSFFAITHRALDWDVPTGYQFLSCLAAPFFLVLLYRLARRIVPQKAIWLVLLVFSGGYLQLFFGDMENYTLTALLLWIYFYCAYLYLQGETSFLVPAMVLALAMTFHFEAIFLLPTLFFLSIVEVYRRSYLTLISGWLGIGIHTSLTLFFFGFNGAALERMRDTSWGLGRSGNILANFSTFEINTFFARLNLFALIYPLIYFLLLLLLFRRIHASGFNAFLLVGTLSGVAFALTWKSAIGLYNDWNLFSLPLLPAILLFGYNLVRNVNMPLKKELFFSMTALAVLVSGAWIIQNHLN